MYSLLFIWLWGAHATRFIGLTGNRDSFNLTLSHITINNSAIRIDHIANLAKLGLYLSATYNGTHISTVLMGYSSDDGFSVYTVSTKGYISPYHLTIKKGVVSHIEQDGHKFFGLSIRKKALIMIFWSGSE
jgi:hypothetical protein